MNDVLRQRLCELFQRFGLGLLEDRPRLEAELWLAAGEQARGLTWLLDAFDRRVPHALLKAPPEHRGTALEKKLCQRLLTELDIDEAQAIWAVTTWREALMGAPPIGAEPLSPPSVPKSDPPRPVSIPSAMPDFAALPRLALDEPAVPSPPARLPDISQFGSVKDSVPSVLFSGHGEAVNAIDISPDGGTLATAGADCTVRLWDITSGELLSCLTGHGDAVSAVAFAADGATLASSSLDGVVLLWDVEARTERLAFQEASGWVTALVFTPDGQYLAGGCNHGGIRLWNPDSGELHATLNRHRDAVTALTVATDATLLVSGSEDQSAILWDLLRHEALADLNGHRGAVRAVAMCGLLIATGSEDRTVRLWEPKTPVLKAPRTSLRIETEAPVLALAFLGRDLLAVGRTDGRIEIVNPSQGDLATRIVAHDGPVTGLVANRHNQILYSCGADRLSRRWDVIAPVANPAGLPPLAKRGQRDKRSLVIPVVLLAMLALWGFGLFLDKNRRDQVEFPEMPQGMLVPRPGPKVDLRDEIAVANFPSGITCVAVAGDGNRAMVGTFGHSVYAGNTVDLDRLVSVQGHKHPVLCVAVSGDGKRGLSGDLGGVVILWNLEENTEERRFQGPTGATGVSFAPDGKTFLASYGWKDVKHQLKQNGAESMEWHRANAPQCCTILWDSANGQETRRYINHAEAVTCVAFLPDGKRAVTGSFDKALCLFDVETGKEIQRFRGHDGEVFCLAVSADGTRLLSGCGSLGAADAKPDPMGAPPPPLDFTLREWDLATGKELRCVTHGNAVLSVGFALDDRHAVSASFDGNVHVWNLDTGKEQDQYDLHRGIVQAARWIPQTNRILSGSWDGALRSWVIGDR